ncbi:MAG: GcrA cell cycle regulator [Acetobacteraceae bacterium]|nr:GcrA cell cycle regulator [Acetobacteraceae bacterium]
MCPGSVTHESQPPNEPGGAGLRHARDAFNWTRAAIEMLRGLWTEGLPTAEIARRLGTSKNAVVGKAHRLQLPKRNSPIRPAGSGSPRRRRRPGPVPKLDEIIPLKSVPVPATPRAIPPPAPRPIRTEKTPCCWPVGEPGTPGFRFCEALAVSGRPYCQQHCAIAYQGCREASG